MITIHEIRNGTALTLELEGRLDTTTSPTLQELLEKNYPVITELVFDFTKVEYMSSSGLRVLLIAQRAMMDRGGILIRHPNHLVREVFRVTGFEDVLRIE